MKIFKYLEIISLFHSYMLREATGDAKAFSQKLQISRASLFNLINGLREQGIDIDYSRQKKSYYYLYPGDVEIIVRIGQSSRSS